MRQCRETKKYISQNLKTRNVWHYSIIAHKNNRQVKEKIILKLKTPFCVSEVFAKHKHSNSVWVCYFLKEKCFNKLCYVKTFIIKLLTKWFGIPESQVLSKKEDKKAQVDDKWEGSVSCTVLAKENQLSLLANCPAPRNWAECSARWNGLVQFLIRCAWISWAHFV